MFAAKACTDAGEYPSRTAAKQSRRNLLSGCLRKDFFSSKK